jgi:hypothetical protein
MPWTASLFEGPQGTVDVLVASMYVGVVRERSCKIERELWCIGRYGDHYCLILQ